MFHLPAHWLNHDLATVPAGLATVDFRVAAHVGADGAGRDAQRQGDFGGVLPLLEHLVDGFDILFFHR